MRWLRGRSRGRPVQGAELSNNSAWPSADGRGGEIGRRRRCSAACGWSRRRFHPVAKAGSTARAGRRPRPAIGQVEAAKLRDVRPGGRGGFLHHAELRREYDFVVREGAGTRPRQTSSKPSPGYGPRRRVHSRGRRHRPRGGASSPRCSQGALLRTRKASGGLHHQRLRRSDLLRPGSSCGLDGPPDVRGAAFHVESARRRDSLASGGMLGPVRSWPAWLRVAWSACPGSQRHRREALATSRSTVGGSEPGETTTTTSSSCPVPSHRGRSARGRETGLPTPHAPRQGGKPMLGIAALQMLAERRTTVESRAAGRRLG